MKKIFLVTLLLLLAATSYASQKTITDTGEQVILNSDGTSNKHKYKDQEAPPVKSDTARELDFGGKSQNERKSNYNMEKKKESDINDTK